MRLINSVFELSEEFMKNPKWVEIEHDRVAYLVNKMEEEGKREFIPEAKGENERETVFKELIASAINYCYWYGKHDVRPGGCSSGKMYDVVNEAVDIENHNNDRLGWIKNRLRGLLSVGRFPLLEERLRHIDEVVSPLGYSYANLIPHHKEIDKEDYSEYYYLEELVRFFPGFASDMFLKRASLFFMQLYRTFGWFEDLMKHIHIPADYQVPKILRGFGAIRYLPPLDHMVNNGQLINKSSDMECEIRAATILVCRSLGLQLGWNAAEIDGWLWLRRHEVDMPFHLTITTDY
jgi:hypothetical protein